MPYALPPVPALEITQVRQALLDKALLACGRLDAISSLLPDPEIFLYSYVRREAVLSSQIEGTQSSLSDLIMHELGGAPGVPFDDVSEVSNYVAALEHGVSRMKEGFPLSNRLLRELHQKLLFSGRGSEKQPGEFRKSQNWLGGTRAGNAQFVPPPAIQVENCMAELESFLHAESSPGALIKAALAHVQFETIHPFLDGNGRVGRLLIALVLHNDEILHQPLLYLSLYFKKHREEYYRLLDTVRRVGNWEEWLDFFLEGVVQTATEAVENAHKLLKLFQKDLEIIKRQGKTSANILQVFDSFCSRPIATIGSLTKQSGTSFATTSRHTNTLLKLGIIVELTGRSRERVFAYKSYLEVLNEGAEPF